VDPDYVYSAEQKMIAKIVPPGAVPGQRYRNVIIQSARAFQQSLSCRIASACKIHARCADFQPIL